MQIEPRVLKGFRDFLPDAEQKRKALIRQLEQVFESHAFVPIDTPILEYTDVLLGKGGGETDKQVYRFEDHGGRDVSMRFDLTVPFARYMALHRHELYTPFKRYHINKVFRGENTQRGRYREFVQCDFDIVGTSAGPADIEVLLLIIAAFEALSVPGITVHLSHRGIFNRFLEREGVRDKSEDVLRIVDKLRKIGAEQTRTLLSDLVSPSVADRILTFVAARGSNDEIITTLETLLEDTSPEIAELRLLVSTATALGYGEAIRVDPSITRGLDYYTGIVFETFLIGAESIGSVCSGGRYDDLVSLYSKETMPGVGASIGLDRLIAALETFDDVLPSPTSADVLVVLQDPTLLTTYHEIARELRADGIRCEVYPEVRKLGQQFAFAEKKGIPIALVCGESEVATGVVNLRELATRTNHDQIPRSDMAARIRELLP